MRKVGDGEPSECFDINETWMQKGMWNENYSRAFLNRLWNEGKKKGQSVSQSNCEK